MQAVQLVLLLLLGAVAARHHGSHHLRRGSPCRTRAGLQGRCASLWDCMPAQRQQVQGIAPTRCSRSSVCCPTEDASTAAPPTQRPTSTAAPPTQKPVTAAPKTTVSKSQQKCEEWGRAVFRLEDSPLLIEDAQQVNRSLCALEGVTYIIGGEVAQEKEFPHMAAIGYGPMNNVQFLCGGTLISERWVLTAAHCLDDYTNSGTGPPRYIRLGDIQPEAKTEHLTAQDFRVEQRIWHPEYRYPLKPNDVGLIRLDVDAVFNEYVRPACLYTQLAGPSGKAVATGWGRTEKASYSDTLMKVELPLTNHTQCVNVFKQLLQRSAGYKRLLPNGVEDSMLCAGEPTGGKDSCQGDSGGPLQVLNDSPYCTYSVLGIVSFGKGCAEPDYPAVYTRVSTFAPWIESIAWP